VGDGGGAVVDVAEGDEGHALVEDGGHVGGARALHGVRIDPADRQTAGGGEAFEDVAVGGGVGAGGDDRPPAGAGVEGGGGELVEIDGRRVGDDHLAGPGAEDLDADEVADAAREVQPSAPSPDEVASPLPADDLVETLGGGARQAPQRVAVEVDQV